MMKTYYGVREKHYKDKTPSSVEMFQCNHHYVPIEATIKYEEYTEFFSYYKTEKEARAHYNRVQIALHYAEED